MEQSFSPEQQALLDAVRHSTFREVQYYFKPEYIQKDDKWFDYFLLLAALQRQHKTIINFLLKNDCRVRKETPTESFFTPLHYAVIIYDVKIARKLLKKGASIYDKDFTDKTPLYLAALEKKRPLVHLMLNMSSFENVSPTNNDDRLHFHIACMEKDLSIIKKFIRQGFGTNDASILDIDECRGYTSMHFACNNSSYGVFDYLLEMDPDLCIRDAKGHTPIHIAHYNNFFYYNSKFLDLPIHLYQKHFDNPIDENGLSHFHISCTRNAPKIVEIFINNKVDLNSAVSINATKSPGYAPLHFAVSKNCKDIVELLVKKGANIDQRAKAGLTPLHLACRLRHIDIIKLLLKYKASINAVDDEGRTPLHCAFYQEQRSDVLIDLLLTHVPKQNNPTDSRGLSYFHIACMYDNLSIVESLLSEGVSIDSCVDSDEKIYSGYYALHFAVYYNNKNIVELLLKQNANVNVATQIKGVKPLHLACQYDYGKFYQAVDASKKENSKEIDWSKSRRNQIEIVKLLLTKKANVDTQDSNGETPFMYACRVNINSIYIGEVKQSLDYYRILEFDKCLRNEVYIRQKEILDLLLCYNASIRIYNNRNASILHLILDNTSSEENAELAQWLLAKGADVHAADDSGKTPLHATILKSTNEKMIEVFLKHGANVNSKTKDLMTPLHYATQNLSFYTKYVPIVEILLKNDSDVNAQNKNKETPLHLAFAQHSVAVLEKLLYYGGDINLEDAKGSPTILPFYTRKIKQTFESSRDQQILDLIELHIKKLLTIGHQISNKIKEYFCKLKSSVDLEFSRDIDDVFIQCTREVDRLKNVKIDSYTSLYDIMFKHPNEMVNHLKNETLKVILTGDTLDAEFPLYGYILKSQLKKGLVRSTLLKPAKESLESVTSLSLPDCCSESILQYLINQDLEKLIKASTAINYAKRKSDTNVTENDEPLQKQRRLE